MKRFTAILLIFIWISCGCSSTEEPEVPDINREDITAALTEKGVPESFLQNLELTDLTVMYEDMNGMELGTVKLAETAPENLQLSILAVPVSCAWKKDNTVYDCIRVYGTYTWNNSGLTMPREDEIKLSWNEDHLLLADHSSKAPNKVTRSYKGNAEGNKMKCHYDEPSFAHIGQGDAGWFHPIKADAGKHMQKGFFSLILLPTYTPTQVLPVDSIEMTESEIELEYIVHYFGIQAEETYSISAEAELYIPE